MIWPESPVSRFKLFLSPTVNSPRTFVVICMPFIMVWSSESQSINEFKAGTLPESTVLTTRRAYARQSSSENSCLGTPLLTARGPATGLDWTEIAGFSCPIAGKPAYANAVKTIRMRAELIDRRMKQPRSRLGGDRADRDIKSRRGIDNLAYPREFRKDTTFTRQNRGSREPDDWCGPVPRRSVQLERSPATR